MSKTHEHHTHKKHASELTPEEQAEQDFLAKQLAKEKADPDNGKQRITSTDTCDLSEEEFRRLKLLS